jgi:hypothetical protein
LIIALLTAGLPQDLLPDANGVPVPAVATVALWRIEKDETPTPMGNAPVRHVGKQWPIPAGTLVAVDVSPNGHYYARRWHGQAGEHVAPSQLPPGV